MTSIGDQKSDDSNPTNTESVSLDLDANVEYWSNRWVQDDVEFHMKTANPFLEKFLSKLTDDSPKRFFVPLCGKSVDLVYLREQGHEVFAVEAVKKPVEDLEAENSLGLKFNEAESIYSTEDGKLVVYLGDLFKCPFEKFGPFDCVWDRGSFIALQYPFRPEYIKAIQRSLRVIPSGQADGDKDISTPKYYNFRYLLHTVDYDRNKIEGPPNAVDEKDMEEFYGNWTNVEVVLRKPAGDNRDVEHVVYFLTPKV